jgi:two-component system, sensor histidine kinase LadS
MKIICLANFLFFSLFAFCGNGSDITIHGGYSVDWNSGWGLNDVRTKKFTPFKENKVSISYNKNAAIWCAFKLRNTKNQLSESWLCFDNNHLDSIELFDNGNHKVLGDRTKNVSPFLETQAFKIVLKPNEERLVYVRLKKGISFFEFSYHLDDDGKLAQQSRIKIALISFFLGIIFLLILFNAILLYYTRNKMYLYYILYSMLSGMYIMISSYYAKFFILTDFLYFSEFRI